MKILKRLFRRCFSWATSAEDEESLRAEIEEHIALQTAENLRAGLPPHEARRQALLKFGNVEAIKELHRDQRGLPFMETLLRDIRHAVRRLRKAPGFSTAVILTLALGIGGNTAIFAVIDGILIRPLAYPHSEGLVALGHLAPGLPGAGGDIGSSISMFFTYREENRTFQQFGIWNSSGATITGIAQPEMPRALFVSQGVLEALDVPPLLGRWFSQTDVAPGSPQTVILTYPYWQRRFGGDKSILGRTLTIDSQPHVVIGVMPEKFRFQRDPELILPQQFERDKQFLGGFGDQAIVRLKPGVTLEQANADVTRMLGLWIKAWDPNPGLDLKTFQSAHLTPHLRPLKDDIVGDIGRALWVVMGTLGLVLLIACANVANLFLVRADARQQEFATRAALGAGWSRIARQMLVECMTLGVTGGAVGLGLAYAALRILVAKGPDSLPRLDEISLDPLVLAFTVVVSLLSGALFSLIPIVKYAGPRIASSFQGIGRAFTQSRERHRASSALVVVQVALALILLIGSGLMIRTFQQLRNVDPGFTHPEDVLILHSMVPDSIAGQPQRVMRMQNEILDKLASLPGVTSVGFGTAAPMESLFSNSNPVYAEDRLAEQTQVPSVKQIRKIAPGYFKTLGTRVIVGRDLTWGDLYDGHRVAIVSENVAREWWGDPQAALGKRIREGGAADPWREIVGVVQNIYDDGVQIKPPGIIYWPALMDRYIWAGENGSAISRGMFAIRSPHAATDGLANEARQAIWSVNGRQPVFLVSTLKALYDQSMARTSFTLVMLALAGGMALLLGIVGIYGVIAYAVSQRTREIGIRTALGARPEVLLRAFVRQALRLAGIGAAIGLAAAAGLMHLMSALLFGVAAVDPLTYAAVSALLICAAGLASYIPARRAMSVDPVQALRAE